MTFKTENAAEAWGSRMLKKYFPADYVAAGWHLRVWENIGWHVAFQHGPYVQVYWSEDYDKFWCLIGEDQGGRGAWTPNNSFYNRDPVKAVQATLQFAHIQIRADIIRYNATAKGICREELSLKGTCLKAPCGVSDKHICVNKPTGATGAILACKQCPAAKRGRGKRV